jgi:curved DNA-binding protein
MVQNYYDLLGVSKTASDKEIKTAYRRMARKLHPDVNPDNERAQDEFKKVNEAYEVVGDPERRKDYDQFGDNWKHADQMRNMGGGRGSGPGMGMGFNLSDLFGTAGAARNAGPRTYDNQGGGFGDMFGVMGGQPQGPAKHKGSLDVSLDEVYTGTTRWISIGNALNGKRNLEVDIPKGVRDGRKIVLRPDRNTEVSLTVNVRAEKRFTREGANLRAEIAVPLLDAVLGGEVEVPTMVGRIALQIPAGTQNGRSFKIKGKGLPKQGSDYFGDLYATINVRLPESLTVEEQALYSKLRNVSSTTEGETSGDDAR